MAFRVGQKVVCVNDGPSQYVGASSDFPPYKKGAIYTVVGHRQWLGAFGVYLAELPDEGNNWKSHDVERFRPIVERKTDISIFTAMLTGSKIGADA